MFLRQIHTGEYYRYKEQLNQSQNEQGDEAKIIELMDHYSLSKECFKTPKAKIKFQKKLLKLPGKIRTSLHSKKMSKGSIKPDETIDFEENVMLFVDIHGHSTNDNIFMYGCKGSNPEDAFHIKEIPKMIDHDLDIL